jgi:daunorubicin resistance ABC transporter membrane protein
MSRLAHERGVVAVLWWRDLLLFARQPSRLAGALLTPLLLWLAIGAGVAPSFAMRGGGTGYMEYFYPGVVLVLVLQVSISATMSVIEDRRQGFLQGVLVAPASRAAVVLGKTLGSATVAMIHALLFVALAPLAGYSLTRISLGLLLAALAGACVSLTVMGFMLAWLLDSIQGYHVVMNLVLFPAWILSGAMFPAEGLHPVLGLMVRWNPMSHALAALRRALYGGSLPVGAGLRGSTARSELLILGGTTAVLLALACWVAHRRPAST